MRHILVKYSNYWADEFPVEGFAIMDEKEYLQWEEDFRKAKEKDYEWYFGTNEFISYWNESHFNVITLSKEEVLSLVFLMDLEQYYYDVDFPTYGLFPTFVFWDDEEDE